MLVEGTHFLKSEKPQNIGRKAAAVSLSDMAAMGAIPLYMILSLGISRSINFTFVKNLFKGISSALAPFNVKLIGGDTVRSPHLVIDSVIIGTNRKGKVLKRNGAKPGEIIFTTGYFGHSFSTGWHYRFIPRIKEMQFLKQKISISSAIDASDGLYASLRILSQESKVSLHVDCSKVLLRKKCQTFKKSLETALFDGEDFELVFTGNCHDFEKIRSKFKNKFGVPLTIVGKVCPGKGLKFYDNNKRLKIKNKEFQHFG